MPILTFPDGNTRAFEAAVTGRTVVEGIAKSLAKRTVAMALDGTVRDLDDTIDRQRLRQARSGAGRRPPPGS